jgi:hypothetical protein
MISRHLDYYVQIDGIRQTYASILGCGATDAWYLYQYLMEIRQLKAAARKQLGAAADIPRKEKYFLLHALLRSMPPEVTRISELGSSLLEIIDGLETMRAVVSDEHAPFNSPRYSFVGIEKSEFLAEVSQLLHPNHDITLLPSVDALHQQFPRGCGGIVYDRIVSSSAFHNASALAEFLSHFDAGILNLLTSRNDSFISNFFGADYTYFSLAELDHHLPQKLFHLFGFRAPKHAELRSTGRQVIEGFFFFGDVVRLEGFVGECAKIPIIREFFAEKKINPTRISALI